MDWVEEKIENLRIRLCNMSFRKAMIGYTLVLAVVVFLLSCVTIMVCYRWETLLYKKYDIAPEYSRWLSLLAGGPFIEMPSVITNSDNTILRILEILRIWCPFFYGVGGMMITICIFYKQRLKKPFEILQSGTEEITKQNLEFPMYYDSQDEMGELCDSFERMRKELISNKSEMWKLIDSQKQLNAAFAHDLRTPLTVLKGYSDFLARYIPEGKVSEEKTLDTLKLMSSHLERLEQYSRTMNGIRNIEEMPIAKESISLNRIQKEIGEVIFALNQIGDIQIVEQIGYEEMKAHNISVDRNAILEVLENLLSNAIRYALHHIQVQTDYNEKEQTFFLSVKDDGSGFEREEMAKMLAPYEKETTGDSEHFGIGLHICSLLCNKHGGTISIANSMSGGAIVTASFYSGS